MQLNKNHISAGLRNSSITEDASMTLNKHHIVLVIAMTHKPWIATEFVTVHCQPGQLLWLHMHGL